MVDLLPDAFDRQRATEATDETGLFARVKYILKRF